MQQNCIFGSNSRVLVRVSSALGGNHVLLATVWLVSVHVAILKDGGRIAKDKVDRTGNEALDKKLAVGMDIEGVLVGEDVALGKGREIGTHAVRDGLAVSSAGGVLKGYVSGQESLGRPPMQHATLPHPCLNHKDGSKATLVWGKHVLPYMNEPTVNFPAWSEVRAG